MSKFGRNTRLPFIVFEHQHSRYDITKNLRDAIFGFGSKFLDIPRAYSAT